MNHNDGIAKVIILSGVLLFVGPFIGPVSTLLHADGYSTGRPSGLYTNRHHHELRRQRLTPCAPDFERAKWLAEQAVGADADHVVPGTYHTNSQDINPEYSPSYTGPLPGSVYVDIPVKKHRRGRHGTGLSVQQEIPLDTGEAANIVGEAARRDCLDIQK